MRNAFVESVTKLAEKDERVVLLTGDLGFKIFDDFKAKFPDRFYNVGIAEANMISMAAGLCLEGYKPFVYSIAPFATLRCCEQIKLDLCYNNKDVVIIGAGAGITYGHNGPTHHTTEDIGVLRSIPNIRILCPGDKWETLSIMDNILDYSGPKYLRLGNGKPVYSEKPFFLDNRPHIVRAHAHSNMCIFTTGNMLDVGSELHNLLKQKRLYSTLISVHTIKPLDADFIRSYANEVDYFVCLEEHNVIGGLSSTISEVLAEMESHAKLIKFGIKDKFITYSASQQFIREHEKLTIEEIVEEILEKMDV